MGVVTRAKKRRLEEEERFVDRISSLPDDVLGDIVSLLPTKAGARTQVLASRWRHIWRSAPLNVDIHDPVVGWRLPIDTDEITHVLSTHPGPGRRFSIPKGYFLDARHAAGLDGWLRSPALENLQELQFVLNNGLQRWSSQPIPQAPLPAPVYRFSSSLHTASFGCCIMPDGDDSGALHFPVLKQMTLFNVNISERSMHAILAGCTVLQSLLLHNNHGFSRLQVMSPSLRSIGVRACQLCLLIMDTPCLERLLIFDGTYINILLISAPRLGILGKLFDGTPCTWHQFRSTIFQGSTPISTMNVVYGVKILALCEFELSLDAAIDTVKCFPHLEKIFIKVTQVYVDNVCYDKYQKLIGTHDIRLRKIVQANYQGSKTDINFVKFFVSNARVLESMRLELNVENLNKAWAARQRRLIDMKKRASRGARITFVTRKIWIGSPNLLCVEHVHDLSVDPFERFR